MNEYVRDRGRGCMDTLMHVTHLPSAVVIFSPDLGNYDQPSIQMLLVQSAARHSCLFHPVQRRIMRLRLNDSSGVCRR